MSGRIQNAESSGAVYAIQSQVIERREVAVELSLEDWKRLVEAMRKNRPFRAPIAGGDVVISRWKAFWHGDADG